MTLFEGVPTMYAAMLHDPQADERDVPPSRCASRAAPRCRWRSCAFEQKFGCQILEAYGLSETSPVASSNRRDRERKPDSIGLPVDGVEMPVIDDDADEVPQGRRRRGGDSRPQRHEGLLEARGSHRRSDRRGRLVQTGDMATVDEDGYFFIVDRKKDLANRGGYNVYPREIEEVF